MNLPVYGRVFRITACDAFTKEFLLSNGIDVNDEEAVPEDTYTVKRKVVEQPSTLATTKNDFDKLKQFIELDRKVLRFYCVWDDRANLYGELRPFVSAIYQAVSCRCLCVCVCVCVCLYLYLFLFLCVCVCMRPTHTHTHSLSLSPVCFLTSPPRLLADAAVFSCGRHN